MSHFLLKLTEQYDTELDRLEQSTPAGLEVAREQVVLISIQLNTTNLNITCQKLNSMLKQTFLISEPKLQISRIEKKLTMANFDIIQAYSRRNLLDLFAYDNQGQNLFSFLLGIFRTIFSKTSLLIMRKASFKPPLIDINVITSDLTDTTEGDQVKTPTPMLLSAGKEIKNIDDSSSDTDDKYKTGENKSNEDEDDCLLIGSLFDQLSQPNNEKEAEKESLNKNNKESNNLLNRVSSVELDDSANNCNSFSNVRIVFFSNI